MIVISGIFLGVYTLSLGSVILLGFLKQRKKEGGYQSSGDSIDVKNVVVLVPFRNEEHRIGRLLESINQLQQLPARFIFIDDHSDDASVQMIQEQLQNIEYLILPLPEGVTGKKAALRYAIKQVTETYILTMDADITIPPKYFDRLAELDDIDMFVLPAIMQAGKPIEYLYEVDLILVNAANAGLAGWKRPIVASGANLFYRKDTFERVDDLESHVHAASGDDTYLLRDFRENGTDVRLHTDPTIAIYTETPQSFKEFIDQRLRWIGKTGDIKDNLSTGLAILQSILTIGFLALCILLAIWNKWEFLAYFFIAKTVIDMVIFLPYFNRIKRLITWSTIPLYEIFFPLYTLLILLLMFVYKPKWKGRAIYEK